MRDHMMWAHRNTLEGRLGGQVKGESCWGEMFSFCTRKRGAQLMKQSSSGEEGLGQCSPRVGEKKGDNKREEVFLDQHQQRKMELV